MSNKCGCNLINIEKIGIPKVLTSSSPTTNYAKGIKLPYNPYISSITGAYALEVGKYTDFKVYFWTPTDDPSVNPYIQAFDTGITLNWPDDYKASIIEISNKFTNLFSKSSIETDSYANSSIVCVLTTQIGPTTGVAGQASTPQLILTKNSIVDGKLLLFLNINSVINTMTPGGYGYLTSLHEFGHIFGLNHPHDTGSNSTLMPGLIAGYNDDYKGIAGYIQNNVLNTIVSYIDKYFFYPSLEQIGVPFYYPSSLMPLDYLALKWMYKIQNINEFYCKINTITTVVPNQTRCIIGKDNIIIFENNIVNVNFYFNKKSEITYKNTLPLNITFNRIMDNEWAYFPIENDATVKRLELHNTGIAFVFVQEIGKGKKYIVATCKALNIYFQFNKCNCNITTGCKGIYNTFKISGNNGLFKIYYTTSVFNPVFNS